MQKKLQKTLNQLGDDTTPLSFVLLKNLSDLSASELGQFQEAWQHYSGQRRHELARAMAAIAEDDATQSFTRIFDWLLDDNDPRIRRLAVDGLWEEAGLRHLPRFMQMLHEDADKDVRAAAAMTLGRLIFMAELDEITGTHTDEMVEALWQTFHEEREHVEVRRRALEGLSYSSRPGVKRLIENAVFDESELMRISALFAMGQHIDQAWLPYLQKALGEENPALRMEAARALGNLEAKSLLDTLISMLDVEKDSEVRFAILEALGQIGGDKAKQALQLTLESDDEAEAEVAEMALEYLYSGIGNLSGLIHSVLGIEPETEEDEDDLDTTTMWGDFYEDPLNEELRHLLDDEGYRH
jgi:HEAT repeat protein